MPDKVGKQIGHHRLVRLLGSGGFAEVYLGEHLRLKTLTAIKILHTSLEDDDVESFLREAQTVARLKHPHIVRVFDFDVENRIPFLVMDYLPNGNVRRFHPKGSLIPLATIVSYVTQVASALQYAHDEKLIHRDIKPENMLLDRDNTIVLSDFGIAIMAQSSRYQSTQQVAGTAAYMAPEQFQGKPRRASDQYSLGIVVYEWLTGEHPFHGSFTETASQHLFVPPPSLREKVPTISPEVEQVVLTTLAKDPEQRFGSVQAFANAFKQASRSSSPESVEQTPPDTPTTASSFHSTRLPNQTIPITSYFQQSPPQQDVIASPPNLPRPVASGLPPIRRGPIPAPSLRTVLLVAIALLLVMSGFVLFPVIRTNTANALATATAQAGATVLAQGNATATAQAVATATAQINATATAQAVATATTAQQIYTQDTSGTPAISDQLSDDRNSWGVFTTNWGGACAFTGGAYHVSLAHAGYIIWCASGIVSNLNTFALQVDVTITRGDDGCVVFGSNPNSWYRTYIGSNGSYLLTQYAKSTNQTQNLRIGSSSAIKTGLNQVNIMTIIVNNGNFYLYVNGQFVTNALLSFYYQGGAGVTTWSANQPTEAVFSNLKVWTL